MTKKPGTDNPAPPGAPAPAPDNVQLIQSDAPAPVIRSYPVDGLVVRPGTPLHLCPGTLPRDKHGIKARFNAVGPGTLELGRDGSLLIRVQDLFAHPGECLNEETGAMDAVTWLVLIDPAGERFCSTSPVLARKFMGLLVMRSEGVLDWPVDVQVVTRRGKRSGRPYHDLILL